MPWFGGLILEERPDGGQEDYYAKPLSSAATYWLFIGKYKVDPAGPWYSAPTRSDLLRQNSKIPYVSFGWLSSSSEKFPDLKHYSQLIWCAAQDALMLMSLQIIEFIWNMHLKHSYCCHKKKMNGLSHFRNCPFLPFHSLQTLWCSTFYIWSGCLQVLDASVSCFWIHFQHSFN